MDKNKEYLVGLEWTNEVSTEDILNNLDQITCLEFIPENFFDGRRSDFLEKLRQSNMPILVHSVEVSFGTMEPLKEEHFQRVLEVAEKVNTVDISDHLSMTEADGIEIGQLTPIPWTIECADAVCRNIEKIQSKIDVSFCIENITNRFQIPNTELTETQFINRILDRTGCGFLLDLNNVHTNATNFHYDPREWIESIDLSKVEAVHLAGGYVDEDGVLVDSHSREVPLDVWDLFTFLCERITPRYTIVEWTAESPDYPKLLSEVRRAESILDASVFRSSPQQPPKQSSYQREAR